MIRTAYVCIALVMTLACGGGGSSSASADAVPEPVAEVTPSATELPNLGLKIDLPQGARVSEMMGMIMVSGGGLGGMNVKEVKDGEPRTLDEVKKDIEMYTPTNLKEETLQDGFVLTFENTGGMGTNYWGRAVRTVAGKTISCSITVMNPDQQKKAIEACKSIHP